MKRFFVSGLESLDLKFGIEVWLQKSRIDLILLIKRTLNLQILKKMKN